MYIAVLYPELIQISINMDQIQPQNNPSYHSDDNQAIVISLICFLVLVIVDIFIFWTLNIKYSADYKQQMISEKSPEIASTISP